jgi:4-hydroxy-tetrahydrodipicolinate reductase
MNEVTVIGINGAAGRMGQRLLALAREDPELSVGAALEVPGHPLLGRDAGEAAGIGPAAVNLRSDLPPDTRLDVAIDFSTPQGTQSALLLCVERRLPLVVATTGHTAAQREEIESAAHEIPILMSPNMSLTVNVLFELVARAARLLAGKDFDVEIVERHHRYKKDAPSGTALHLARIVQEAMGQTRLQHGREGIVGERRPHEIGLHALRTGDSVGEHTVILSTLGESLELAHKGHSRDSYARGALLAAKFVAGKRPGTYGMRDVLGLA